jgi:hypothetical protein
MKQATNIAIIAALLALAFLASGAVLFFAGCGLFFFALGQAMDFYAVEQEKKNDDQLPEAGNMVEHLPDAGKTFSKSAQHPDAINTASTGSPTDGITIGKGYVRNDEQATAGDYTNPNAPADTVQIGNVDAPAKSLPNIQLEMI